MNSTVRKTFTYRDKSLLVYIHLVCVGPPILLPFSPVLLFTYSGAGTKGPGKHPDLVLCCSNRIIPQIWYLLVSLLTPKRDLQQLLLLSTALALVYQTFLFCQLFKCLFFWHDSQIANRDASNCVRVSLVLSLMDYSPGEVLVCGRLPHDLLSGWHFSFIIAYPIGKISWLVQVSTAPNAKRVEADKTMCNMVWRAGAFAVKWM